MSLHTSSHGSDTEVNSPATERDPLPPWINGSSLHTATTEQVLLYFAAGPKGDRSLYDPIASLADRCAVELSALARLIGPTLDDVEVADLLGHLSERMRVLAILIGRAAHRAGLASAA